MSDDTAKQNQSSENDDTEVLQANDIEEQPIERRENVVLTALQKSGMWQWWLKRTNAWRMWRQNRYPESAVAIFATYVTLAVFLVVGFHAISLLILWQVMMVTGYVYLLTVAKERTLQQPTPIQAKRKFNNEHSSRVDSRLIPRVLTRFTANPITSESNEVIVRLALRANWFRIKKMIGLGVVSLVVLSLPILLMIYQLVSVRVGSGLLMMLVLAILMSAAFINFNYESVFHVTTNYRILLLTVPSPWTFWKKASSPSAPLAKVDFSNPRSTWWGRRKWINSGTLSNDTASSQDDVLNRVDYVTDVLEVAGEITELQMALMPKNVSS